MQLETLTIPSASDRWPKDHPDEDAREQPKGGAILLASTGTPLRGAVRIRGLPLAALEWPGHENRHTTGLEVATLLDHTFVLLRSDSGQVRALTGRPGEEVVASQLAQRGAEAERVMSGKIKVYPDRFTSLPIGLVHLPLEISTRNVNQRIAKLSNAQLTSY